MAGIQEELRKLNPHQLKSAMENGGVIRTLAGPGTGKTGTQTTHIARLIADKVSPAENILSLTFTNLAADESQQRIAAKVGPEGFKVFSGTYHRFVRQHILTPNRSHPLMQQLGYGDGFIILDDSDARNLMREARKTLDTLDQVILDAAGLKERQITEFMSKFRSRGLTAKGLMAEIKTNPAAITAYRNIGAAYPQHAKLEGQSAEDQLRDVQLRLQSSPGLVKLPLLKAWSAYSKACQRVGGIDFDDQLLIAHQMVTSDVKIARKLADRFHHVFLDEFQDTNPVQWEIIRAVVAQHPAGPNLYQVGDTRQAIYAFREADVSIMLNIDKDFPQCVTHTLPINYRSTSQLIKLSNVHAATMRQQINQGQLKPGNGRTGTEPTWLEFNDDRAEAKAVVARIRGLIESGTKPRDIAVMYRSRPCKEALEDELKDSGTQYHVVGDANFWESRETKDTLAILRTVTRAKDLPALSRVLDGVTIGLSSLAVRNALMKTPMNPLDYLKGRSMQNGARAATIKGFYDQLIGIKEELTASLDLEQYLKFVCHATGSKAESKALFEKLWASYQRHPDSEMSQEIARMYSDSKPDFAKILTERVKAFWEQFLRPKLEREVEKIVAKKAESPEDIPALLEEAMDARASNVDRVLKTIVEAFMSNEFGLADAVDDVVLRAEEPQSNMDDCVTLLTLHASKGLEFPHTFMIACEQESHFKDPENINDDHRDEESRLFYVGITRAESSLTLTSSRKRFVNGETKVRTPAEFLVNLEPHLKTSRPRQHLRPADNRGIRRQPANDDYREADYTRERLQRFT